ncbi:MAG: hypothetical protein KIS94_11315 [Chitinophagales bacterium]|nr:hypothetical protein [Chitinophagales bacterium]
MKRTLLFKTLLAALLIPAVLFTVSFHEVHFLFADHHEHEHCDNHLHGEEQHAHCKVCKFTVSLFTDEVTVLVTSSLTFSTATVVANFQSVILYRTLTANPLRGPPSLS